MIPRAEIRVARSDAERTAIFRLRYRVYVTEMRRHLDLANHAQQTYTDTLDTTPHQLGAYIGQMAVATLRIHALSDGTVGMYESLYGLMDLSRAQRRETGVISAFLVEPMFRQPALVQRMLTYAARYSLEHGLRYLVLDCSEQAEQSFAAFGFRFQRTINQPYDANARLMRLDMRDDAHLHGVASPLAPQARPKPIRTPVTVG